MNAYLSPSFLDVVVCPACRVKLAVDWERAELVCTNPACGLAFPIREGIPVLLIDEARKPERG